MPKKFKRKSSSLLQKIIIVIIGVVTALIAIEFKGSRVPSPITAITKPGSNIKGNISLTTGNKIYHVPGMEDYESTIIDSTRGERWFCTESEALSNGWRKAPR